MLNLSSSGFRAQSKTFKCIFFGPHLKSSKSNHEPHDCSGVKQYVRTEKIGPYAQEVGRQLAALLVS